MAAITALTEDFTGAAVGTAVSTSNTIFDNVAGTAIATIITDPFLGGSARMMEISGTAQDKYLEMDFAATNMLWFNFDYDMVSAPSVNTMILQGYIDSTGAADTGKIFDVRANTTRALTLRSVSTGIWTSTALTLNTKYRVFVGVSLSGTKSLRCVIYNADGTTQLQDSGVITITNAATTISHLRIGTLLSSTFQHRFGRLRGDTATGPDAPPPPPPGGVTSLDTVAENFTGAANGVVITEANTIFSHVSGEGVSAFANDPIAAGVRAMRIETATNDKYHHVDFDAVADGWVIFDLVIDTVPTVNHQFILQVWGDSAATVRVSELRILVNTRTIQIRNAAQAAQWTSTTLAAGEKHRIAVQSKLGATAANRRMRVMVLSGGANATVTQDSGELVSDTTAATFNHFRIGHLNTGNAVTYMERIRGSLTAPAVGNTVDLGPNQDVKTGEVASFTVATSGTGTLSLTQTAGPTVTLTTSGSTRSFVMPGILTGSTPAATTVTFSATYGAATDTVSFLAPAHDLWRVMEDGSRKPINRARYVP